MGTIRNMDSSSDYVFTIFYFMMTIGLIYPPTEFVSAGLTISSIFQSLLGKQHESFTKYHLRKSCLNLFIYSALPLGYLILSCALGYMTEVSMLSNKVIKSYQIIYFQIAELLSSYSIFWRSFTILSIIFPLMSLYVILNWSRNNFENHPISKNLSKFSNNNTDWRSVANDIDSEFRR